jgi:C-terminal processing protease CtpA/Prc
MRINNILTGLVILCWFLTFSGKEVFGDEVYLKDGSLVKGLVLDNFYDRIVLSTPSARLQIEKKEIKEVFFELPEQNFFYLAQTNFEKRNLKEARLFLLKTLAINPEYKKAKDMLDLIKNYEISKNLPQEIIEDKLIDKIGLFIKKDEENRIIVEKVLENSLADMAGIQTGDILYCLYSQKIKYAPLEFVKRLLVGTGEGVLKLNIRRKIKILVPERHWYDIILRRKKIGFVITLMQTGLMIKNIQERSPAYLAGIRRGDMVVSINGKDTRFMPLTEVRRKIYNVNQKELTLEIQRSFYIKRNYI